MECRAPGFSEDLLDLLEEKSDSGGISIQMDGKRNLWKGRFDYHPDATVIPFEHDDHVLLLKPGETEVSLHVRMHPHSSLSFKIIII